jgi:AcrR family transcriptional regulator
VTSPTAPRTARARIRDELTREIKAAARRQLSEQGSAALSLRAVARELGMASSAVYRYFATRDELLTALIVDAYEAVAEVAEQAEASVAREDHRGRWLAAATAVRTWAVSHRHEYELVFGSPVPGYAAPQATVDPAARIPLLLVGIAREAAGTGLSWQPRPLPAPVASDMRALAQLLAPELPEDLVARLVMAWTHLIGAISFELFGHLVGSVTDYPAWFLHQMEVLADGLGLA